MFSIEPNVQSQSMDSSFLKSLGFPSLKIHHASNHYDFRIPRRRILVIGPMGSGKTEFSARVWRDSQVLLNKNPSVARSTCSSKADRRNVFFVRSSLDEKRFPEYPIDALAYRSGYARLGDRIAKIKDSFELEELIEKNPEVGTWVIDEASFYEERLVYVIRRASEEKHLSFIFPSLVLNFRRDIFNSTARLLLENATDVFPLTAYCEHPECVEDSFYTYRWYDVEGCECPAPFFDPLIIIGGDRKSATPSEPNYCTRCDVHHFLPGKEYTYLTLRPLGQAFAQGEYSKLFAELQALQNDPAHSQLAKSLESESQTHRNTLKVPYLAERALFYLFVECTLIREEDFHKIIFELGLARDFLEQRLYDNGRVLNVPLTQESL